MTIHIKNEFLNQKNEPIGGVIGEPFNDYAPPSWDIYFMRHVYEVAEKSKDPSTKIGAVIVKDKHPILFGYNGLPHGVNDFPDRMERPLKYKYTEHGERNSIYCGAKFGIATEGTIIYTQALPCCECARAIVAAGIIEVVLHKPANDIFAAASHYSTTWKEDHEITNIMFKEAKIKVRDIEMFVGKYAYIAGKKYKI